MKKSNLEGMTCLKAGAKFDKIMDSDGAVFEMFGGMCMITIGLTDIQKIELAILKNNEIDIYLSLIDDVIFISASFEDEILLDMPFNAALYKEFEFEAPEGRAIICPVVVVENRTNIIQAIRLLGFDPEFSEKLYRLAMKQRENGIDSYDERLRTINEQYHQRDIIGQAILKNRKGMINYAQ